MAKNGKKNEKGHEQMQKSPPTAQNRSKMWVWIKQNGKKCPNPPRNGVLVNIARFGQKVSERVRRGQRGSVRGILRNPKSITII